jgi:hypothetical protein
MSQPHQLSAGADQSGQGALPEPLSKEYYGEYDENGVDLSLIRYMLTLSPLERLRAMDKHARDTLLLLDYGRKHREAQAGKDR